MVPIKSNPIGKGKGLDVALGFATGGPIGAAMALLPDSPAKKAAGIAQMGAGLMGGGASAGPPSSSAAPEPTGGLSPKLMEKNVAANDYNPMSTRLESIKANPKATIENGLAALRDSSVPQYMRDAYAEPFLRAKHFGGIA